MPAQDSRQNTREGGGNSSSSDRSQRQTTSGTKYIAPVTRRQTSVAGETTATATRSAVTRTTTNSAGTSEQSTSEDKAFTLTFTVPLGGAVPCSPI
jgi:hypothetical protein